jgi:nitronate monooxygenase
LAAGYKTAEAMAADIEDTRARTQRPFGVNVFSPQRGPTDRELVQSYAQRLEAEAQRAGAELGEPKFDDDDYAAKLELLAACGVHTVSFTFGCPSPEDVRSLERTGTKVAVTVTGAAEARIAAGAGADSLIVQGTEAGGHQGSFDDTEPNHTPLLEALAAIRGAVDLPLVAAGGIATAADVHAALDTGAAAVQVGTALLCTPEAATSAVYREALLSRRYPATIITRAFSGRWARGLANRFAREHPDAPAGYPQVHHLTRPLRAAATRAGDPDVPNLWAGTGWADVREEPAAAVVQRLAAGL